MSATASFRELAQKAEDTLEDMDRPSRTLVERTLALGEDFTLAIAFFALGFIANLVANLVPPHAINSWLFISAAVGLIALKFWGIARGYESARDGMAGLARDARLVATIVDLTVETLEERQRVAREQNANVSSGVLQGGST